MCDLPRVRFADQFCLNLNFHALLYEGTITFFHLFISKPSRCQSYHYYVISPVKLGSHENTIESLFFSFKRYSKLSTKPTWMWRVILFNFNCTCHDLFIYLNNVRIVEIWSMNWMKTLFTNQNCSLQKTTVPDNDDIGAITTKFIQWYCWKFSVPSHFFSEIN